MGIARTGPGPWPATGRMTSTICVMRWACMFSLALLPQTTLSKISRVDHVVIGVPDIPYAMKKFEDLYGLKTAFQTYDGKYGKGAVIPVGNSFLQLLHIDASSQQLAKDPLSPYDAAVSYAVNGKQFVTWALADDYADLNGQRLNSPVKSLSWTGQDGVTVPGAKIMGFEAVFKPPLPFFIQWNDPKWQSGQFMTEQTKKVKGDFLVNGIAYMELSGRHDEYYQWVGDSSVYVHWTQAYFKGQPSNEDIVSVALNTTKGLIILREGEMY